MVLQEQVYSTLSAALGVPVVKYSNEYDGDYPVVVYKEVENVPALFGDNVELLRKIVYQVSIGTEKDEYGELERDVLEAMTGLGFTHVDTTENFDKVFWREIKFVFWR